MARCPQKQSSKSDGKGGNKSTYKVVVSTVNGLCFLRFCVLDSLVAGVLKKGRFTSLLSTKIIYFLLNEPTVKLSFYIVTIAERSFEFSAKQKNEEEKIFLYGKCTRNKLIYYYELL